MDNLNKEQRHKNMKNIKDRDTKIEVVLKKAPRHKGIMSRQNYYPIPRNAHIVLTKYKIAVFCDGEFFHGCDWINQHKRLMNSNNSNY